MDFPQTFGGVCEGPRKIRRKHILCFDGTGNKFSGTEADSNILKIFRMLDCADAAQSVYYQPGIGTYVQSNTYSHTSLFTKTYSWAQKTRDSMIGSSFDQHLMAGYKFLMKYYAEGDDVFIFGFSRGSYTARFLAEMLDMVGLLPRGMEEMARFAFKAFAKWQRRLDGTDEEKVKKREMFDYLTAWRETFSRPVRRIRFLGLFDTVNSVPRFEGAFLKRSKFPYTARSSALRIRHAVSIDERRCKFRQDLLGETQPAHDHVKREGTSSVDQALEVMGKEKKTVERHSEEAAVSGRFRRASVASVRQKRERSKSRSYEAMGRRSLDNVQEEDAHSIITDASALSLPPKRSHGHASHIFHDLQDDDDEDEALPQDIQEIWFPGCHADIGGGWPLSANEHFPLAHAPLVWMVREAQRAGLTFLEDQMVKLKVVENEISDATDNYNFREDESERARHDDGLPEVRVTGPTRTNSSIANGLNPGPTGEKGPSSYSLAETLRLSAETGVMHDSLRFGGAITSSGVIGWRMMEWLPFARMDLQPDNSWNAIRWPLPRGEVRDIPNNAVISTAALRRMKADPKYRPGNLIVGGGGRGVVVAPKEHGVGEWEIFREKGDVIGECVVRKKKTTDNGPISGRREGSTM